MRPLITCLRRTTKLSIKPNRNSCRSIGPYCIIYVDTNAEVMVITQVHVILRCSMLMPCDRLLGFKVSFIVA